MSSELAEDFSDRLPPHSIEAEQGVLGCALISPDVCLPPILAALKSKSTFYDLRHQIVFSAIAEMHRAEIPIDIITVQQRLRDTGLLEQIGGIVYLGQLQDAVTSTANLSCWLDIVREKFELRRIVQTCADVTSRIYSNTGTIDDLKFSVQSDLAEVFGGATGDLPLIVHARDFISQDIPTPDELVKHVLHKGTKIVIGGGSKAFKTWTQLDLAVSVAAGIPWIDFETVRSRVLYVNFEIQEAFFKQRVLVVSKSKGLNEVPEGLDIWNLRGFSAAYHILVPQIISRIKSEGYSLIILDPIYKLYGKTDENSAGEVAMLLNALETICVQTGSSVAFGAHYSKGNQSNKESIDRISGSGVFARDPDSIISFTKHEEHDAFTIEPILRNLAPVEPFVVRWQYPLMKRDENLDPSKLKQIVGRKKEHDPIKLLEFIKLTTYQNPISISQWATAGNVKRQTLSDYLPDLRSRGFIATAGEGLFARQYITENGLKLLQSIS